MAFVRWRKNCAQLLTTVYENGRSRQILLVNFRGAFYATDSVQQFVAARFPEVEVDWKAVNRALAAGAPGDPPLTPKEWDWAEAEDALRRWAKDAERSEPRSADCLQQAAEILTHWRAQAYQSRKDGQGSNPREGVTPTPSLRSE